MKVEVKIAKRSSPKALLILLLVPIILLLLFNVPPALAHDPARAYSNEPDIGISNPDWMSKLPDSRNITTLSIPGTHETMSDWGEVAACQSASLAEQLDAGIRALDIRIRHTRTLAGDDRFWVYHGPLKCAVFDEVLDECTTFLAAHSGETILMRLSSEGCTHPWSLQPGHGSPEHTFMETFDYYMLKLAAPGNKKNGEFIWGYQGLWWKKWNYDAVPIPLLKDVRGKIVILQQWSHGCEDCGVVGGHPMWVGYVGLDFGDTYGKIYTQDVGWNFYACEEWINVSYWPYKIKCIGWNHLYHKWTLIRDFLEITDRRDDGEVIYINFLSGSGFATPPWWVASGHISADTDAGNPWTGITEPPDYIWPEFPRAWSETLKKFKIYYEGTNEMFLKYLGKVYIRHCGIIMADFPGPKLIDAIIHDHNNTPPVANANGSYEGDEGSEIIFDASKSSDADGDPLYYRWDFESDDHWDTTFDSNPKASGTFSDEFSGQATLEVNDTIICMQAKADVIVNNAAPAVTVTMEQPNPHFILPNVHTLTFTGNFTDPGWLDTHTAEWDFGDESIEVGTLTEENEEPDATGTTIAEHAYSEPGTYTVTLTITDDDGGTGKDTWAVTVLTDAEAITVVKDNILPYYPDYAFKNCPDQRKTTFSNKLDAVIKKISEGEYQEAIDMLRDDIKAKVDGPLGCGPRHDWITDAGVQEELCMMIDDLMDHLERLL